MVVIIFFGLINLSLSCSDLYFDFSNFEVNRRWVAIYDSVTGIIDKNYYDQSFANVDWPKLKAAWRRRAQTVQNDKQLYFEVIWPMIESFPVSHLGALPPPPLRSFSSQFIGKQKHSNNSETKIDFTEYPMIRRNTRSAMIIGDVMPKSDEAKNDIIPGSVIQYMSVDKEKNSQIHIKLKLFCLTIPENLRFEKDLHFDPITRSTERPCSGARDGRTIEKEYSKRISSNDEMSDPMVRTVGDGIKYIKFNKFEKPVLEEVVNAINNADKHGLILDLRYNTGGYPDKILDALMPQGTPLYRRRLASGVKVVSSPSNSQPFNGPLVLLIGPASASAAELTAAVGKATHRALTIGRPTNGAVLGAGFFQLPDGGVVQVPIEGIETMDGNTLEGVGVSPDIEILPSLEALRAGRDQALERAVLEIKWGRAPHL